MLDEMLTLAREAMDKAYAPYSRFHVGSVILSENNKLYAGCNVENAAYPEGCCAEASAISAMIMGGDRIIKEVVVMGQSDELVSPCGGCRQRLNEFALKETLVHICGPEGVRKTIPLGDLLPLSFGPKTLEK